MNTYGIFLIFLLPVSSICFQSVAQEPLWIWQNLQHAYNSYQYSCFEQRSPNECQQDIAAFIGFLSSDAYKGLYTINEQHDQTESTSQNVLWLNKERKVWKGVKKGYGLQIAPLINHFPLMEEDMLINVLVAATPDFNHTGVIKGISVPQKLRNKAYELALINWGCYKIKQLQPHTNTIFFSASLYGNTNEIAQRIALFLRAGFRPFRKPYYNEPIKLGH